MNFLNPWALMGICSLLIPLLLHFLNQSKLEEKPWAAMQFLMAKESRVIKRHSLQEWLLLTSRLLLFFILVLAMARPIGNLFSLRHKHPDSIFILLDRSAIMGRSAQSGEAILTGTLQLVKEALKNSKASCRFYLIDSATLDVLPVLDADNLEHLGHTSLVDSPCRVPKLLEKAFSMVASGKYGKAECWIVAHPQQETWQAHNERWRQLGESYQTQKLQDYVSVRYFPVVASSKEPDLSLTVENAIISETQLSMMLNIKGGRSGQIVELSGRFYQGREFQERIMLNTQQVTYSLSLALERDAQEKTLFGELRLPKDGNNANNIAYFGVGTPLDFNSLVITDTRESVLTQILMNSVALPKRKHQKAKWILPEDLLLTDLTQYSLIIWASNKGTGTVKDVLSEYVQKGGVAIVFSGEEAEESKLNWFFGAIKEAPQDEFFHVQHWEQRSGPWRNTKANVALPLERVLALRYALMHSDNGVVLSHWNGGDPLLKRIFLGDGTLYLVSTLPHYAWSNLENLGLQLILFQRLIQEQLQKQGGGYMRSLSAGEPPFMAGRLGDTEPIVYNRPPVSSEQQLTSTEIIKLLEQHGIKSQFSSIRMGRSWTLPCLYLGITFLVLETWLGRLSHTYQKEENRK